MPPRQLEHDVDEKGYKRLSERDISYLQQMEEITNNQITQTTDDFLPFQPLLNDDDNDDDEQEESYREFVHRFLTKKQGGWQLLLIGLLLSISYGSTVALVPDWMGERYARLHYGYHGTESCFQLIHSNNNNNNNETTFTIDTNKEESIEACRKGSDAAQHAAAVSVLVRNGLSLFCNPLVGSYSDSHGRKGPLILGIFLSCLSPFFVLLTRFIFSFDAIWFYTTEAIVGFVDYMPIIFAYLADKRAPGIGLFLGCYYFGMCFAPSILTSPIRQLHNGNIIVACMSFTFGFAAFLFAIFALPDTKTKITTTMTTETEPPLSSRTLQEEEEEHEDEDEQEEELNPSQDCERRSWSKHALMLFRPLYEMSILNRNISLRLIAVGSFISGMVFSTDATFVVYYMENHLGVSDVDLARMFLVMGTVGILIQAVFLKPLITLLTERGLLVASFVSGCIHNVLYGIAKSKLLLWFGLSASQFTKTNFALLSSLAAENISNHEEEDQEQGRLQGALFAVSAVSNAIGPLILEQVYKHSRSSSSPGMMFVVAGILYFVGAILVSGLLCTRGASSRRRIQPPQEHTDANENVKDKSLNDSDIDERRRRNSEDVLAPTQYHNGNYAVVVAETRCR